MKKKQPKVDLSRLPPGIDFGCNWKGMIDRPFNKSFGRRYGWYMATTYAIEIWKINQRKPIR